MNRYLLLCLAAILALDGCGPKATNTPPTVVLTENGGPKAWKLGTRISMQGDLVRNSLGTYLLQSRIAPPRHPELASRYCALLRFPQHDTLLAQQAKAMAKLGLRVVAVGTTSQRNPSFPVPAGGPETHDRCNFDLLVDQVSIG